MDQVAKVKKHLKREQWLSLISDCQTSGMTVRSWCKQNQICEQTYYRNLRMLREKACSDFPLDAISTPENLTPASFKKLEVQAPVSNTQAAVIIHLPAATIEVANGASQQTVEAVLLALKNIC